MIMLLLFIFFMTITLQNLMNLIALIDAQEIINEAQIISIKKRISLISYEMVQMFKDRLAIFSKNHMNRFVLTPSESRQLVLFDPLNVHKAKKSKFLVLSKESFEKIRSFCDARK
jgi:hypothetical protein